MPTNGTLKYKQDDGSIVELNPAGVDAEARALATAEANRAKAAEQKLENDKADKSAIPDVSALVTKEIYDAGQAAQDAKITALETGSKADVLPYTFGYVHLSTLVYNTPNPVLTATLPWLHSGDTYPRVTLSDSVFYLVNLEDGTTNKLSSEQISAASTAYASTPYHISVNIQVPLPNISNSVAYLLIGHTYINIGT